MQRNPCYARLFADLTYTPPNPIIASGGCGPRTPKGFSTGCERGPGPKAPGPALSGRFAPRRRSSQRSLCVAAKAASFNSLAHWASASLFPPLAALGSAPLRRVFHQRQKDPKKRLPQTKRAAPDERRASIIRRKTGKVFQLVFPRFFKSGWGSGGKAPGKIQRYPQRPYAVSISKAASRRHTQNTSRAASSSATGGRLGAMRILLSWGSLP